MKACLQTSVTWLTHSGWPSKVCPVGLIIFIQDDGYVFPKTRYFMIFIKAINVKKGIYLLYWAKTWFSVNLHRLFIVLFLRIQGISENLPLHFRTSVRNSRSLPHSSRLLKLQRNYSAKWKNEKFLSFYSSRNLSVREKGK